MEALGKEISQDLKKGPYRGRSRTLDQNSSHFPTKGSFPCQAFVVGAI